MLIYHPAFDAYHCLVRFCSIFDKVEKLEVDRLRIFDFCLSFPTAVGQFKLPKEGMALRSKVRAIENPYRLPIGIKTVFADLQMIHLSCLACLAAAELIEVDGQTAQRTSKLIPTELQARCTALQVQEEFFFVDTLNVLQRLPLSGAEGLKARSGLLEYRYDA